MPIVLTKTLPAYRILRDEGVEVVPPDQATDRQAPSLRVALLNLMPEKTTTETQIARLLGETAHRVELTFFVPDSYCSKTTPAGHLAAFYQRWSAIRGRRFDGLIVTGAPVETLPFEDVTYWNELTAIFDWARRRVGQSYYICWAAQAALNYYHGVPKRLLPGKMFGVFAHRVVAPGAPLMAGLEDGFRVPVSRHTEVAAADLPRGRGLEVLAESDESGLCLVWDATQRAHYMFNHLEYDARTLAQEYERDRHAGRSVSVPRHYFPGDDPAGEPTHDWRGDARILFRNWLNQVERRARAHTHTGTQAVDWLLSGPGRAPAGAGRADFLVGVEDRLIAVPDVLRVLAGFGLSPTSLRVAQGPARESTIRLSVSGLDGAMVERVARQLLRGVVGARHLGFRDAAGAGGVLVASGAARPPRRSAA